MLPNLVLLFLAIVKISTAQRSVESAFKSVGIVSDVIDRAPPPNGFIEVTYPNATVDLGNELTPTQVRYEPIVTWTVAGKTRSTYYTLLMVDPDVPSRSDRSMAEIKHWLVGNILGNEITTGEVITPYLGAAPEQGTFHHRYVFLLYQQPNRIDYSREPRTPHRSGKFRTRFSTRNFTQQYMLGDPVGGNFFVAQYDATVDEIRMEFGLP